MPNIIKNVAVLREYKLQIFFENGTTKVYDALPLVEKWPDFAAFQKIPGLFEQVKVDVGGYGISWNDDLDLSCDELWDNGR